MKLSFTIKKTAARAAVFFMVINRLLDLLNRVG